ncbi:proteinase inhibitor type-2 CEVI57-like [Lycium ferocissimum]|uniref:proteinase inhibitor type-2 CEVI57-like n=1 Tax=Lycium ferocissimum TaxID=112874 RepID=UPI002815CC83|nr:proteinase inhibitor type-2 CEVI57-like [Lycium ferocissimum]
MALNKVALLSLLILFGTFLLLSEVEYADAAVCPRNCDPKIRYGRCPKSGNKKFKTICTNCCAGLAGCNYFTANGTFICEGETESKVETIETRDETMIESNKICPFNCNPRIAYSICPGNKRSSGRICTNCCAGRKGCNYFSTDGTFVCEGESEVESKLEVKPCPRNCDSRVSYMTCPGSGLAKLSQVCVNCCSAGEGCKLYGFDRSLLCTGGELESY